MMNRARFTSLVLVFTLMAAGAVDAAEKPSDLVPASLVENDRDLALKQTLEGDCGPGDECRYLITLTNNGKSRFAGALNILRTANYRLSKHAADTGITCKRKLSVVACRTSRLELEPGKSFQFESRMTVAREARGEIRNCSLILYPGNELKDPYEDMLVVVQLGLKAKGYYTEGKIDGKTGPKVRAAIEAFRKDEGLPEGRIDRHLLDALFGPKRLMKSDGDPDNDHACDVIRVSDTATAASPPAQPAPRRVIRRAPAPRRNDPGNFASPNNGVRANIDRLGGLN